MRSRSFTRAALRSVAMLLAASAGLAVAACTGAGASAAEYVVIESDKFT